MKKGDLCVVMLRKRPKVAVYVGPAPEGDQHIVNLETLPNTTLSDLRLVAPADIFEFVRQPEVRT